MAQIGVVDSPGKIHQMLIQLDTADKAKNPYQAQLIKQAIDNAISDFEIKDQKRLIQDQATKLSQAEGKVATSQKELAAAQGKNMQQGYDYGVALAQQKATQAEKFYNWKATDNKEDLENDANRQEIQQKRESAKAIIKLFSGSNNPNHQQMVESAHRELAGIESHPGVAEKALDWRQTQHGVNQYREDAQHYTDAQNQAELEGAGAAMMGAGNQQKMAEHQARAQTAGQLASESRQNADDLFKGGAGEPGAKLLEETIKNRRDLTPELFADMTDPAKNYIAMALQGASAETLGKLLNDITENKPQSEVGKILKDLSDAKENPAFSNIHGVLDQGAIWAVEALKKDPSGKAPTYRTYPQKEFDDSRERWLKLPGEERVISEHELIRNVGQDFSAKYKENKWWGLSHRWVGGKPGEKLNYNSAVNDMKTLLKSFETRGYTPQTALRLIEDLEWLTRDTSSKISGDATSDERVLATVANIRQHYGDTIWKEFKNELSTIAQNQGSRLAASKEDPNDPKYKRLVLEKMWATSNGGRFKTWTPKSQQQAGEGVELPDDPSPKQIKPKDAGKSRPKVDETRVRFNKETNQFESVTIAGKTNRRSGPGYTTKQGVTVGVTERLFKDGESVLIPKNIGDDAWYKKIAPGTQILVDGKPYTFQGYTTTKGIPGKKPPATRIKVKGEGEETTVGLHNTFGFPVGMGLEQINNLMRGKPTIVKPKREQPRDVGKATIRPSERDKTPPKPMVPLRP